MTSSLICLDSNVIIKTVFEVSNVAVQRQWDVWHEAGRRFVAPTLQRNEFSNGLHRYQTTGLLTATAVDQALAFVFRSR